MSRKWKAALAPWLAGIPVRTGFAGELRFGLLNDVRFGERKLPRMIDQMGALALPRCTASQVAGANKSNNQRVDSWRVQRQARSGSSSHYRAIAGRGWGRQSMARSPLLRPRMCSR
jgi:ADP-heptose:LPS heptosyltransferase